MFIGAGHAQFFFERWQGEIFVGLVWFAFLFRVGLMQFFVGVALSEPGGVILVGLGRQIICLDVGLAQFFVLLSELPVRLWHCFVCAVAGTAFC